MLSARTVLVIGIALSAIVSLVLPKRARPGVFFGGIFTAFGAVSLLSGRVVQEWDGGPPLEGPLAVVFSLVIIAIGIYVVVFALLHRTDDDQQNDHEKV